jgi:hypothetical protein
MQSTTFKSWTRDKLLDAFGLERTVQSPIMQTWLASQQEITDFEKQSLLFDLEKVWLYIDFWNEEEVKIKLIGTIVRLVGYDSKHLSAFADRTLRGIVDGIELYGEPDLMVARGKQEVKSPFFFIHEYKKEAPYPPQGEIIADPAGQLLAAMLVAYENNLTEPKMKEKPIYGAYVIGRNWFFVILQGREYAISRAYDATQTDDLLDIFRILKAHRQVIREIWGE